MKRKSRPVCKPHSVQRSCPVAPQCNLAAAWVIISLRARVAAHLVRPTRDSGCYTRKRATSPHTRLSLLGLAPDGGYLANRIAADAGGLLHHRFTLTLPALAGRYVSVALSGGLPRPGYYPTSRSLECGLSSALTRQSRDHPTDLAHLYHTQNFIESQAWLIVANAPDWANVLDLFIERYSCTDTSGLSFTHDMGTNNNFAPKGMSAYELPQRSGVFSSMTHKQLLAFSTTILIAVTTRRKFSTPPSATFGQPTRARFIAPWHGWRKTAG